MKFKVSLIALLLPVLSSAATETNYECTVNKVGQNLLQTIYDHTLNIEDTLSDDTKYVNWISKGDKFEMSISESDVEVSLNVRAMSCGKGLVTNNLKEVISKDMIKSGVLYNKTTRIAYGQNYLVRFAKYKINKNKVSGELIVSDSGFYEVEHCSRITTLSNQIKFTCIEK